MSQNATLNHDDHSNIRWAPSARRTVTGLSCVVETTNVDSSPFDLYSFPDFGFQADTGSTLFFSSRGPTSERVVYTDGIYYAIFREAVLAPFDEELPAHLRDKAP